ncbi:MAG: hypothetical protein ACOY0T_11320 [Myxococcota bacterium]
MRSLRQISFCLSACSALFFACEPDLDKLSSEYGFGGTGGTGGTSSAQGGAAQNGGSTAQGGVTNSAGMPGEGGTTAEGGTGGSVEPPDSCTDLRVGADETDVDCGGTSLCQRCGINQRCTQHSDCVSATCINGRCVEPTCTDGLQNQNETAEDCGGVCAVVSLCDVGEGCRVSADCASEFCASTKVCQDHCVSKKHESDETDVDCGGATCAPCAVNLACVENKDCASGVCKNKVCQPQSCEDQIKNQDESDIDCGGVCSPAKSCPVDAKCIQAADCASYVCTSMKCVADITIPTGDMIDDLEDGNLFILALNGRTGNWFSYGDGTGSSLIEPFPLPAPRAGSTTALHYAGSGFMTWGSGIGFDFNNTGGSQNTKNPWDASAYNGITFWAKATTTTSVNVQLPDRNTQARGGICTTCDHHWQTLVSIGTEWKRYTVRFADLQLEPGTVPTPTAFDKTGIIMLQIFMSKGKTFDLLVDDVALIK